MTTLISCDQDSVAMAQANVFSKNGHSVPNKIAKFLGNI
jgi:hypothetical protein